MKIIKQDARIGLLIARAESLDDLWYLSQIIREGDLVKAKTSRLVKAKDDKIRSDKGQKQVMILSVTVDKAEFDHNANRLRVLGRIAAGPEDLIALGAHHTLEIDEHGQIELFKQKFTENDLKYIKDAKQASESAKTMICVIGDGEATVAVLRERGLHYIDTRSNIGGKYVAGREDKKKEFYSELLKVLSDTAEKEGVDTIIIGGPGFEKRNFYDYARERSGKKLNIQVIDCGCEGKSGVSEILKGGALDKILEGGRLAKETKLVESFLTEVARDGLFAYGKDEIEGAVDSGAVEMLLVLDRKLRENRGDIERIIDKTKQGGGEFHVLNSEFEAGQKIAGFGGLAAILRYKI